MHRSWIVGVSLVLLLFVQLRLAEPQSAATFSLSVPVDEVSLAFHAVDAHGLAVNDLRLDELQILDDGHPPQKVLYFRMLQDAPIRAGILMDMSESMQATRALDRGIANRFAQQILRQTTDQAFVMDFDSVSKVVQPWSSDPAALAIGVRYGKVRDANELHLPGTAIFDAVYRACLNEFGHIDHAASGNFILLFSDGEDNASRTTLSQAVGMCQRSNTAIYAFRAQTKGDFASSGPQTLAELTAQTGGRMFRDGESQAEIDEDLHTIEASLRNEYRLIFKPAGLKHDGAFHPVLLQVPERVETVSMASGYYAPVR